MQTAESKVVVSRETNQAHSEKTGNNHARQLAEDGLNKLAAALESGKSEALVNYLSVMSRFHRYSWNNCLLIALQRPGASTLRAFIRGGSWGVMCARARRASRFLPR